MKKYFITGLVILLPLALTFAIIVFLFNFLTTPFLGIVQTIFNHYDLFKTGFWFLSSTQLQTLIAQVLILFFLFFFTLLLGYIAHWFFFLTLIKVAEYIVKKIPFVRTVYKTCNDIISTLFSTKSQSFKQVVLVRFPNPNSFAIGFITREAISGFKDTNYANLISVFVPTTPNPTSGFLILYKSEDITYLDMKVEDAFKYIISCGLVSPPLGIISQETKPLIS